MNFPIILQLLGKNQYKLDLFTYCACAECQEEIGMNDPELLIWKTEKNHIVVR
jgi:hypothetical protein